MSVIVFHLRWILLSYSHLAGIMIGVKISNTVEDMALSYLATIQGIALGTRHIIEVMNLSGYEISSVSSNVYGRHEISAVNV